jgi:hypothetical protein
MGHLWEMGFWGLFSIAVTQSEGDARELLWEFNRSDVVDTGYYQGEGYVWTRIGIGKMILRTRGEFSASRFDLDLWDATLTGEVETTCGVLRLRSFIHATKPFSGLRLTPKVRKNGHDFGFGADAPAGPVSDFGRVDIEESATHEHLIHRLFRNSCRVSTFTGKDCTARSANLP